MIASTHENKLPYPVKVKLGHIQKPAVFDSTIS